LDNWHRNKEAKVTTIANPDQAGHHDYAVAIILRLHFSPKLSDLTLKTFKTAASGFPDNF